MYDEKTGLSIVDSSSFDGSDEMIKNGHNVIYEDDLVARGGESLCLLLRFRNCTGNIIDLSDRLFEVSEEELV